MENVENKDRNVYMRYEKRLYVPFIVAMEPTNKKNTPVKHLHSKHVWEEIIHISGIIKQETNKNKAESVSQVHKKEVFR